MSHHNKGTWDSGANELLHEVLTMGPGNMSFESRDEEYRFREGRPSYEVLLSVESMLRLICKKLGTGF